MKQQFSIFKAQVEHITKAIETKSILDAAENSNFTCYISLGLGSLHMLGSVFNSKGDLLYDNLFYYTCLGNLGSSFLKRNTNLDFRLINQNLNICENGNSIDYSVSMVDMIKAFVHFNITQAKNGFAEHMNNLSYEDLHNRSIITQGNPYIAKFLKQPYSVYKSNAILCVIFTLIHFTIQIAFKSESLTRIKPSKTDYELECISIDGFSNCSRDALLKGFTLSMLNVSVETYEKHKKVFAPCPKYNGEDIHDWVFYRHENNSFEDLYAISPSVGIKRPLNVSEFFNLQSFQLNN